ncbi:MAG: LysR family transcriptional regulator [Planctomycetia bacterium]|nr:LysR family transcriptional regulator [Planctomycetia bacterium]
MPRPPLRSRPYKELTLQQLRSFSETARLGSYFAAAKSLGLTHPTVREQVLALQREFRLKLIETHGRGCRLTTEGRLLAEMVTPLVSGAATLKPRFESARKQAKIRLTVSGPPRVIQEDLPAAVSALLEDNPNLNLVFLELRDDQVVPSVESGAADIGLTTRAVPDAAPIGVSFETAYELETLLLTAKSHPLARRSRVTPADLRKYPLLSSRYTLSDQPELAAMLDRNRVFDGPTPRVEPFLAGTVRRYVEQNLGIALVYGLRPGGGKSLLHERSMSRYFGRGLVRFVFRNGSVHEDAARAFAAQVRLQNQIQS